MRSVSQMIEGCGMDSDMTPIARKLRRDLTPAEKVLWPKLRGRRFAGLKFRRQQPIGRYVVDFFCPVATLVVELDGETHLGREVPDKSRQTFLEQLGYVVLRFWNNEVFDDSEAVLEAIYRVCVERTRNTEHPI
jgi:very-short-patch-repair endonuclease